MLAWGRDGDQVMGGKPPQQLTAQPWLYSEIHRIHLSDLARMCFCYHVRKRFSDLARRLGFEFASGCGCQGNNQGKYCVHNFISHPIFSTQYLKTASGMHVVRRIFSSTFIHLCPPQCPARVDFREWKSEKWKWKINLFHFFDKWKVNWKSGSLISRMNSEMKMLQDWEVTFLANSCESINLEHFQIFIQILVFK